METIYAIVFSVGFGIGGGLLIFAAVLAIHAWNISKILSRYSRAKSLASQ